MRHGTGEVPLAVWIVIALLLHGLIIGGAELFGPEGGAEPDTGALQAQYRLQEAGVEEGSPRENSPADDDSPALSISFETADPKYQPYFMGLRTLIGKHWDQPRLGAGDPDKGSLVVEFVLGKGGDLKSVSVARSSGVMGFDFAAMEAVKSAAPFEPFPPEIERKELEIRALFVYD